MYALSHVGQYPDSAATSSPTAGGCVSAELTQVPKNGLKVSFFAYKSMRWSVLLAA